MFPLSALIFLSRNKLTKDIHLSKLTKRQAIEHLIHNSFGDLASEDIWSFEFEFFLKLVKETVCMELEIPDDRAKLQQSVSDFINNFDSPNQTHPKAVS